MRVRSTRITQWPVFPPSPVQGEGLGVGDLRSSPFKRLLDSLLEDLVGLRPDDGAPIDHKGRRALYPNGVGSLRQILYHLGVFARIQALIEGICVQLQVGSKLLQFVFGKGALVLPILPLEEQVMVLPESILVSGALAGLSGIRGFLPEEGDVPVAEAYFAFFYVVIFDLATRASGKPATVRSLEVAEFDQRHRRLGVSLEMLHLAHDEVHHLLALGGIGCT